MKNEPGPCAELTYKIIGLAMRVHTHRGPGLFESAYNRCLCHELQKAGLLFAREIPLRLRYEGIDLDPVYKADIIVEDKVLLELKSVDQIHPVHEAQLLTCLRTSEYRVGLLINFNTVVLKDGIRRRII